jgi:deoxyadenosine/deoxycytidine kinase
MYLFTVEGNIGSGKSTFMNLLKENLKHVNGIPVVFVEEPVDEWVSIQSEDGKSMIELFYADKGKYAFSFQIMAYISRLKCLQDTIQKYPDCILISERSLLADYHVFAKMLYEDDLISHENFQIYCKWFHYFSQSCEADGIIYLKTDPEVCYQRCITRNRKGEEEIPLEYLTCCSNKHDEWLNEEFIPILPLINNTTHEVEMVQNFIEDEVDFMKSIGSDTLVDEYINNQSRYISSLLLGFMVLMYMIKFVWMVENLNEL